MDRIEELLVEMCRAQGQATEYRVQGKNEEMRGAVGRRDHLWKRTAADWRAMVEALEEGLDLLYGLTQWIPNDEQEILERMHTTLARVKENDA